MSEKPKRTINPFLTKIYNMKKLLTLLMIAFAAFACQEDPAKEMDSVKKTVEIVAEIEQSRTQLSSNGMGTLWNANETIGVIGKSGNVYQFSTNNEEPAPKATFSGEINVDDSPAYAFYPYDQTKVVGTTLTIELPSEQSQSGNTPVIGTHDFKVGTPAMDGNGNYSCAFSQKFSTIRFDIDATGSDFEGASLVSLKLYSNDKAATAGIAGTVSFDVAKSDAEVTFDESTAASAITLTFDENNRPVIEANKEQRCWITVNPTIAAQSTLLVDLTAIDTKGKQVTTTYKFTVAKTMKRGAAYRIPMKITQLTEYEKEDNPDAANKLLGFKLLAANNGGKILATEIRHNAKGSYSYNISSGNSSLPYATEGYTFEVNEEEKTVNGCVPYLFDFKLAPTFEVSKGATVYVNDIEQVSGQTVNDFSAPVEYKIVSEDGYERTYTISIKNSGLPIVVLDATPAGNVTWQEAGLAVYAKDYDWTGEEGHVSIYNADGSLNVDNAVAGYRLRGNSTQRMPKKPFAIKFDSKQAVLGMPKHKRWCLLANWLDRTMLRNAIAMEVAHATDEATGMGWNPHGVNVEVVYGGVHLGNYYLCEQIKIDGNRVDIQDPFEDVRDDYKDGKRTDAPSFENCGYLMEFNRQNELDENYKFVTTSRKLGVMFKDDFDDTAAGQNIFTQMQSHINNIEKIISENKDYNAAAELINMESFVDWWIVHELMMNNEYKHPKSVYMHQDGAGKLVAGPCWDFDYQTLPNPTKISEVFNKSIDASLTKFLYETTNKYQDTDLNGSSYILGSHVWFATNSYSSWTSSTTRYGLFEHAEFKALVKQRWNAIYGKLAAIINRIDVLANENAISEPYNSAMWPQSVATSSIKNSWNGYQGDEKMTYEESIANLKSIYQQRLEWMNTEINASF